MSKIKMVNRMGSLIEVVVDDNGEEQHIRRNVLNYDTLTDAEKNALHHEIAGVAVTVSAPPTLWQKIKAVFSHKL